MSQNLQQFTKNTDGFYQMCKASHTEPPQLTGNQPELGQVAEEEAVMKMTTGFEMVIWLPVFSLITETVF